MIRVSVWQFESMNKQVPTAPVIDPVDTHHEDGSGKGGPHRGENAGLQDGGDGADIDYLREQGERVKYGQRPRCVPEETLEAVASIELENSDCDAGYAVGGVAGLQRRISPVDHRGIQPLCEIGASVQVTAAG